MTNLLRTPTAEELEAMYGPPDEERFRRPQSHHEQARKNRETLEADGIETTGMGHLALQAFVTAKTLVKGLPVGEPPMALRELEPVNDFSRMVLVGAAHFMRADALASGVE